MTIPSHAPGAHEHDASIAVVADVHPQPPRRSSPEHVEPASVIETRLAELWTELLGVHPIGRFDDFFDLGGSPPLALRLAERIRADFGPSLELDALRNGSTLHEMASRIERSGRRLRIERSIRLGSRDDLPTLYCLPGIGGLAAFTFRDIARHLENQATLVGLQMKGLDGLDDPDPSVEAVASTMLEEIQRIKQVGPIHLCGYSYGGMLAIEIAHQLRPLDVEIGSIILIDTYPPGFVTTQRRLLRRLKRAVDGMRPEDAGTPPDEFDPVSPEDDPAIARLERAGGLGASILRTINATRDAAWRYRPTRYSGDVNIVRSVGSPVTPKALRRFDRLWNRWIGGEIRMHDTEVPHLELVRSGSDFVAAVIREALDAQAERIQPEQLTPPRRA